MMEKRKVRKDPAIYNNPSASKGIRRLAIRTVIEGQREGQKRTVG
jgi:hypothetical protein